MKEPIYGFPCVIDPHDFTPDLEACTPEEVVAWKLDCERWDRGDYQRDSKRFCETKRDSDGQLVAHFTRTPWGIGINMVEIDEGDYDEDGSYGV
jgi:hypothetical protein